MTAAYFLIMDVMNKSCGRILCSGNLVLLGFDDRMMTTSLTVGGNVDLCLWCFGFWMKFPNIFDTDSLIIEEQCPWVLENPSQHGQLGIGQKAIRNGHF